MRILFVTAPFTSHLYVQVPIAWALRCAGHEVRVAAAPELAPTIAGAGLTGVPIGETVPLHTEMAAAEADLDVLPRGPERVHQPDYARDDPRGELAASVAGCRRLFAPDTAFDDLVAFCRAWRPDLVVWDTFVYSGAVAARVCGAASARILFGADGHGQLRRAWARAGGHGEDPLRTWLEPHVTRFGASYDDQVVLGDVTIFPMPPWIWRPSGIDYLPVRHVPFHGPAIVPPWLAEPPRRRRIAVTMGLSHRDHGFGKEASAAEVLAAVADLDVEVVATLDAGQLGRRAIPPNVRAVDFAPLNVLLPTCDAVVHSGGAGTFAAAIEHGVPQLIVPNGYFAEKWWGPLAMADGLEGQGAGRYVADGDRMTSADLHTALCAVLDDPSYREAARDVRDRAALLPSPHDLVASLERLAARSGPVGLSA